MMIRLALFTLFFVSTFAVHLTSASESATYAIVVNKNNPINKLDTNTIKRIFIGKTKKWGTGHSIRLVYNKDKTIMDAFSKSLLNKSSRQLTAYWKRKLFTGKGVIPDYIYGDKQVKQTIQSDIYAISYIHQKEIDDTVKVVQITQ